MRRKIVVLLLTVVLIAMSSLPSAANSNYLYLVEPSAKWDYISDVCGDIFIACENGKMGAEKIGGGNLLPYQYAAVRFEIDAQSGLRYLIAENDRGMSGLWDASGRQIVPASYSAISVRDGYVELMNGIKGKGEHTNDQRMILSLPEGKTILPMTECAAVVPVGSRFFAQFFHTNLPTQYYDRAGRLVLTEGDLINGRLTAVEVTAFGAIIAKDTKTGKFGVCSLSGKTIIPTVHDSVSVPGSEYQWAKDCYIVEQNHRFGALYLDGSVKLPIAFYGVSPTWRKHVGESTLYYNDENKLLGSWDRLYAVSSQSPDLWIAQKDGRFGMITSSGAMAVPVEYAKHNPTDGPYELFYRDQTAELADAAYNTVSGQLIYAEKGSGLAAYRSTLYQLDGGGILAVYSPNGKKSKLLAQIPLNADLWAVNGSVLASGHELYSMDGSLLTPKGYFDRLIPVPPHCRMKDESSSLLIVTRGGRYGVIRVNTDCNQNH